MSKVSTPPLSETKLARVDARVKSSLDLALTAMKADPTLYLFPVKFGDKAQPLLKDYLKRASNDPAKVREWFNYWKKKLGANCWWGIAPALSGLVFADVDTKAGKIGEKTFELFDMLYGWPETRVSRSSSGGRHYWYRGKHLFAVGRKNTSHPDIDFAQYIILPGCMKPDGTGYTLIEDKPIAAAPDWFYAEAKRTTDRPEAATTEPAVDLDKPENIEWAINYLKDDAPPAIEGQGGEQATLKVAMTLRDRGISEHKALDLMLTYYNVPGSCDPEWEVDGPNGIAKKIKNAYQYASINAPGEKTAEADFAGEPVEPVRVTAAVRDLAERKATAKAALNARDAHTIYSYPELCENWIYANKQEQFIRREDGEDWRTKTFDQAFKYAKGKSNSLSNKMLSAATKTIRKFDTVCYEPGKPEFYGDKYNLYKPSLIEAAEGDTSIWNAHLKYLYTKEADRKLVLNWLAWFLQNLDQKPLHALLLHGEFQGTGKSYIAEVLAILTGDNNCMPLSQSDISDKTGWAKRCKLAVIEELRAPGGGFNLATALHPLISQKTIGVRELYVPLYRMRSVLGILAMTNTRDALALDNSDRRWLIVSTDEIDGETLKPYGWNEHTEDKAYYARLYKTLEQPEALAAIKYELLHRDLEGYDARGRAPETAAKLDMIQQAAPPISQWMEHERSNPPLCNRLVRVADIISVMPKRLEKASRKSLEMEIAGYLKAKFFGVNMDVHNFKDGTRGMLWAINGSAAEMKLLTPDGRVTQYMAQPATSGGSDDDADAAHEFAADDLAA